MFFPVFIYSFRMMRRALLAPLNAGVGKANKKQVTTWLCVCFLFN